MLEKLGNGGKGLNWDTKHEVELLGDLNGRALMADRGRPKIDSDIDACETILMLAPETNGEVAVKAWEALGKAPGAITATSRRQGRGEDPLPRRRRPAAQDHLVTDLVGARKRACLLQCGLHQRA